MKNWTGWKGWVRDIGIALLIGIVILQLIKPTIVKEHSMEPNFYENDYIILARQAYLFSEPEYGDVVVFHTDLKQANGAEKMLIKRVIGLPGDTIEIRDGAVLRNGEALDQSFTLEGYTAGRQDLITVPEGCVYVLGDNRQNSQDSRQLGCIETDLIVGKAVLRLFPFNRFGLL
ncbi:MAG: signal peptidase I [Clostridiales bacterium]|nr:signal peptidase I [Clostridiales bacterium]